MVDGRSDQDYAHSPLEHRLGEQKQNYRDGESLRPSVPIQFNRAVGKTD